MISSPAARAARSLPLLLASLLAACGRDEAPPAKSPQTPTASAAALVQAQEPVTGERIRLLLSGSLQGRLEPCGCASGQAGGLARRMQLVRESHVHDLLIEGGDVAKEASAIEKEKVFTALYVLFQLPKKYDALGIGPHDLELPFDDWTQYLAGIQVPAVASDLVSKTGGWPAAAFLEKDVRGTKVRIASLTMSLPKAITDRSPVPLELLTPAAAWQRALLGADDATRRVLLVHGTPEQVRQLASTLQPQPDLVVGIDASDPEPPHTAEFAGKTPIVFPGIRGRYLLDVTIARAADGPRVTSYEALLLQGSETKSDAGQDPATREAILQHRQFVAQENLLEQMADTSKPTGATFAGSAACAACHPQDYAAWQNSKHGHAWETLVKAEQDPKRYGWPVTKYPDCVSCHTTGFAKPGGFVSPTKTPDLVNVGCERCHGPGSAHIAAPTQVKLGKVGNGLPGALCTECHDFEQSPKFDYAKMWPVITHGAKAVAPKKK